MFLRFCWVQAYRKSRLSSLSKTNTITTHHIAGGAQRGDTNEMVITDANDVRSFSKRTITYGREARRAGSKWFVLACHIDKNLCWICMMISASQHLSVTTLLLGSKRAYMTWLCDHHLIVDSGVGGGVFCSFYSIPSCPTSRHLLHCGVGETSSKGGRNSKQKYRDIIKEAHQVCFGNDSLSSRSYQRSGERSRSLYCVVEHFYSVILREPNQCGS